MTTWQDKKTPAFRAELKRRGLQSNGCVKTLINRLEATDELPLDREGRDAYWREEVRRHREAALDAIVEFSYFTRFPPEIREYIVSSDPP